MAVSQVTVNRDSSSDRIRRAAIDLFNARGYHGTPIRALARIVRVEAASLYYHFPSKQKILADIFTRVMDDLLAGLEQAMESGTTVEDRLRAVVRFHVLFHAERQAEANISRSELRSLTPANLRRIIAKRDRYEGMLRSLLTEGVKAGAFGVRDVPVTATAILTMCSEVSGWFSSRGRLSAEAVADEYASMVQQLVGQRDGRASSGPRPRNVPAATSRKTPLTAGCPRRRPRGAADRTSTALGARA